MSARRAVQRRGNPNRSKTSSIITRLFGVMPRALASHPDAFAVLAQQNWNGHKRAGEEREQVACPADPEVALRGSSEQGESRAEHGTDEAIAS